MESVETKPRSEKYFLCFGFENFSHKDLEKFHITLIYFGTLSSFALEDLCKIVDAFFWQGCYYKNQTLTFNKEEMFGWKKDIRVLTPCERSIGNEIFKEQFQTLRDRTEKFQPGQSFPFNPHLATDLDYFKGSINKLFLCGRGYKVIKEWEL